jgi:phage regulator Rha-like protein
MQDLILIEETIKKKIFTIRGKQVMIDSDLAELYGVETKSLNRAVKRNIERFPEDFMFQLTTNEFLILKSQFATSKNINTQILPKEVVKDPSLRSQFMTSSAISNDRQILKYQIGTSSWGGRRKPTYAFTEQGVAMLSSVLNSQKAIEINIQIIRAFVEMRKFISNNLEIFQRIGNIENKQITYDKNFQKVFQALEDNSIPKKGIFFEGQMFEAYTFVSNLIRSAKESIILIDNYVDDSVLTLFSKKQKNVKVVVYTKNSKTLELDVKKFNEQYNNLELKEFDKSHDRFLIIDGRVYHFGASLKDLGKKWFAFSRFDKEGLKLIESLTGV